jgi:HPt (histidine-containing phosphotransfer) domain-containing protein
MVRGEAPHALARIRDALAAGDAGEVDRGAHTLKTSVGVLGATVAQRLAHDVESAGRAGDLPTAAAAFARLEAEVERVVAETLTLAARFAA